jgi:mannosyltransferase OCH1-like enzyme
MKKNNNILYLLLLLLLILIVFLYKNKKTYSCFENYINTFPRNIFQTWKSHTEFPENFDYWRKTWTKYNPTYKYTLFDDNDNYEFIKTYFPWFVERFEAYDKPIKKADAIRYFYLYKNGGIYADLDFECLKSFDDLFNDYKKYGVLLGCMQDSNNIEITSAHNIPNAIMISRPREDFWLCMFHILLTRNKSDSSIENETGPIALKDAYLLYKNTDYKNTDWYAKIYNNLKTNNLEPIANNNVHVLQSHILYPISWERPDMKELNNEMLHAKDRSEASKKIKNLFGNSYAATYWTHSWGDQ